MDSVRGRMAGNDTDMRDGTVARSKIFAWYDSAGSEESKV